LFIGALLGEAAHVLEVAWREAAHIGKLMP
jgi:hypothetical protein